MKCWLIIKDASLELQCIFLVCTLSRPYLSFIKICFSVVMLSLLQIFFSFYSDPLHLLGFVSMDSFDNHLVLFKSSFVISLN